MLNGKPVIKQYVKFSLAAIVQSYVWTLCGNQYTIQPSLFWLLLGVWASVCFLAFILGMMVCLYCNE